MQRWGPGPCHYNNIHSDTENSHYSNSHFDTENCHYGTLLAHLPKDYFLSRKIVRYYLMMYLTYRPTIAIFLPNFKLTSKGALQ